MKKCVLFYVMMVISVFSVNTNASSIIHPVNAWASGELYGAATGAMKVLDDSRLNSSNQLIVGDWSNNWIWNTNTFTSYQWIVVDLGASFDIDEIRIWNYFDNAVPDVSTRGMKDYALWLAPDSPSTVLPVAGVVGNPMTTPKGWRYSIGGGTLAKAPQATVPIDPTTILKAGVNFAAANALGVRYVGIDAGAYNWANSGGFSLGGLAHIQVTAIPEPVTLTLLGLGIVALRRRCVW